MTRPMGRARRVDAAVNEERIVTAARRVFATVGTHKLDDIAAEAGVGIATLYRHFPNKESLARAVYTEIFDADISPLLTLDDATPVRTTITAIAERLLDLVALEPGLIASVDDFAALTDDQLNRFIDAFAELLTRGQARSEIRSDLQPGDIPQLLVMLVSGLTTPGITAAHRSRYLALLLDAIGPRAQSAPLPPLIDDTPISGIRTAISAITPPPRELTR